MQSIAYLFHLTIIHDIEKFLFRRNHAHTVFNKILTSRLKFETVDDIISIHCLHVEKEKQSLVVSKCRE